MPKFEELPLSGLMMFTPDRHDDERGWFSEIWRKDFWNDAGIDIEFVQDNESFSRLKGTVRGLHFQVAPAEQVKLVRVLRGRIFDVVVDIRPNSQSYGKHTTIELSAENGRQLLIPAGFAHGFCTLEMDTHIAYKVSAHYSAVYDRGILWSDPDLGISWPIPERDVVMSQKDRQLPLFQSLYTSL